MNDKDNITIGRPKAGGAIYFAPAGSTLPEDATSSLGSAYVNLGYVTEDGVTHSVAEDTDTIKAWGPETVMVSQNDYSETVTYNLMETIRPAVLQYMRGASNVSLEGDGAIKSGTTGEQLPRGIIVIDTIQNNGSANPRYHRIVFGDCQITDRSGDQTYNNSDPVTFPVTFTAFKFASKALPGKNVYHDDFWSAPASEESES
jgi:hypothetical protein